MRGPVTAYLYVTLRCNARCGFCSIWRDSTGPTMDLDTGLRLVDELAELGVRHVDFTGGEPLICRHLPAFLERAKDRGLFTSVTTNGIAYSAQAERLHGLIDLLSFSLNGADADMHNAVHGVPCFDKVVRSIEKAQELGENIRAQFTVTEQSFNYLPETARLAASLGVPLHVLPVFSYFENARLPDEMAAQLAKSHIPGVRLNPAAMLFHRRGGNNPLRPRCLAGRSAIALTPTGDLLLPCFHRSVGKVSTARGLVRAYNSNRAQRLMQLAGRMICCKGCTNWCYINPSFLLKTDIYKLLHLKFGIGNFVHIFKLKPERFAQALEWMRDRRIPRLTVGASDQ